MVDFALELKSMRKQYDAIKNRYEDNEVDYVVSKIDCLKLCSKAFELLELAMHELNTPQDLAFVGDEGIK